MVGTMSLRNLILILAVVGILRINSVVSTELPEIFTLLNSFSVPFHIENNGTFIHKVQDGESVKIICKAYYPIFWSLDQIKVQPPIIHHQVLSDSKNQQFYQVVLELNSLKHSNRGTIACQSKKEQGLKSEFHFYVATYQPTLIHDRKAEVVYVNSDSQTVTLPCLTDSPLGHRNDVKLLLFHEGLVVESAKYDDIHGFQADIQQLKRLKSNFKFECRLFRLGQKAFAGDPNYKVFFVVLKYVSVSPASTAIFIDQTSSSVSSLITFNCQDTSKKAGFLDIALLRNNGSTDSRSLKPGKSEQSSLAEVTLDSTGNDVNLVCIRKRADDGDGPTEVLHQWRILFQRATKPQKQLDLSVTSDTIRCYSKGQNAKPPTLQTFSCSTSNECAELSTAPILRNGSENIGESCSSNLEALTWTEVGADRGSVCPGCSNLPIGTCDCLQHNATKPGLYRCQQQEPRNDGDLLYLPLEERQCTKKIGFAQPIFKPLFRGINSCSRLQSSKYKSEEDLYWDGRCGIPFQPGASHVLKCVGRRGKYAKNMRITTKPAILPAEWNNVSHRTEDEPENGFITALMSFSLSGPDNFPGNSVLVRCEAPLAAEEGVETIETNVQIARAFRSPGFENSEECSSSTDFVPDCPADNSTIIAKFCSPDTFCNISCSSSINAFPRPQYQWFRASKIEHACSKNFSELKRDPILELVDDRVEFLKFHPSQVGIYICVGRIQVPSDSSKNPQSSISDADDDIFCQAKYFNVKESPYEGGDWRWKLAIGVIIPLFIVAMVFAVIYQIKFRNERHRANMLSKRDIHEFVHGNKEALNSEVDLSEQAHLLPYKNEYEFPFDKLKFGKMLGSGAYGIVYRAEASDIQHKGVETTVAVKTVVPDADLTYFKALLKELKVMIHIGSHLNVVNLLGACTNDLKNKKIFVIVEFCCYGNMQHYIQKYRRQFVDQIRDGKIVDVSAEEPIVTYANLEFSQVNSGSSEAPLISLDTAGSTVSYSNIVENTGGSSQTGEGDQPLWRTNIKGDFNTEEKIPLNTTTFVNWSYQVAKGMEYLALKKVFHGDLAARNVLLAEGGVVKVADFGLARQVYQDANYIKQERCPLPLKWMALESLLRMEFSSKSDVWAFGVLLWEIFTLGQVPYAGEQIDATFVTKLGDGHRLMAPQYATEDIYKMMCRCWEVEPLDRPDFTALADFFLKMMLSLDSTGYERLSALESKTRARKVSHAYENLPK